MIMTRYYYDYSKLQRKDVLDLMDMLFGTKDISVMPGANIDTILLGNGLMFTVEDGILKYSKGIMGSDVKHLDEIVRIMKKLQSIITLECKTIISGDY